MRAVANIARTIQVLLVAMIVIYPLTGCIKFTKDKKNGDDGVSEKKFQLVYFTQNPFANSQQLNDETSKALESLRLSSSVATGLNGESLWSLAQCQCTPNFSGLYMKQLVQSNGTLPQALVPSIREEIKNQPLLRALLNVSPGGFGGIAGSIVNFFMKDNSINNKIRTGLSEKLSKSLPSGTNIAEEFNIFFDLYPSPYVNLGKRDSFPPKTVNISDQASKWAFIFSLDNMWSNDPAHSTPLGYKDHGLQLAATAQTLAEWSYAFGLDPSSDGTVYGGLSFDPGKGVGAPLGAFDPRKTPDGAATLSGTYNITFPSSATLELALNTKETWARNKEPIPLEEQVRLWTAAAVGYQRMKPSSRNANAQAIFNPTTGMFPAESHLISLAFLPGMSRLLDGPFVEAETYAIREKAQLDVDQGNQRELAGLKTLARFARAMLMWNLATETLAQDQLSPSIFTQINASRPKLKDTMRLSIQAILSRHVDTQSPASRLGSIALVDSLQRSTKPSLEVVAETLATMALADQSVLRSAYGQTDFQKKIVGLYHWFASDYLAEIASGSYGSQLSPAAVFWTHYALKLFSGYPPQVSQAPWLADALKVFDEAIKKWDGSIQ